MSERIDVDVVQRCESRASPELVRQLVEAAVRARTTNGGLVPGAVLADAELAKCEGDAPGTEALRDHVSWVALCDAGAVAELRVDTPLSLHVHTLDKFGAERDDEGGVEGGPAAFAAWALPNEQFHGLWESLVYETPLKAQTLRYALTTLELAARGASVNAAAQLACGRTMLFHGPPGTGKTSLCRALAHKLAVRSAQRYPRARLLEINAHALFSKYFSESGKLVARLFERIDDIVDDPRLLAVILVDEVESLTHARRAALAGLEPSDSLRAVNAVLAALDRLRRRPNALVLTTSNITGAIDPAFLDRADFKRLVPPPGECAAYALLRSALLELMACGFLERDSLFAWRVLEGARFAESEASRASLRLAGIARRAASPPRALSGRALRGLPVLALALHAARPPSPMLLSLPDFLEALDAALVQYVRDELELEDPPALVPAAPIHNGH